MLERSKNFGQGNSGLSWGRVRAVFNRNSHTKKLCTQPSNDTRRRLSFITNAFTFSMASSAMEDWDLPITHDTNQHAVGEQTENQEDDFEVERRNYLPQKPNFLRRDTERRTGIVGSDMRRADRLGRRDGRRRHCRCLLAACYAFSICLCEFFVTTAYAVPPH